MTCQVCGLSDNTVRAKNLPEGLCKTCRIWFYGWTVCKGLYKHIFANNLQQLQEKH